MAEEKKISRFQEAKASPIMADKVETLEQKVARLEKEVADSKEIIDGQAAKLQTAELGASEQLPVVTHDKQNYRVLAGAFTFKGVKYTAEELKTKSDVVAALVKEESGVLELIIKEEKAAK
jgi:hypothetical protein